MCEEIDLIYYGGLKHGSWSKEELLLSWRCLLGLQLELWHIQLGYMKWGSYIEVGDLTANKWWLEPRDLMKSERWWAEALREEKMSVWVHWGCRDKPPQTGGASTTETYFLGVLEAGHPRSRLQQDCFLLSPLSLACGWTIYSLCPHTVFPLCACACGVSGSLNSFF